MLAGQIGLNAIKVLGVATVGVAANELAMTLLVAAHNILHVLNEASLEAVAEDSGICLQCASAVCAVPDVVDLLLS